MSLRRFWAGGNLKFMSYMSRFARRLGLGSPRGLVVIEKVYQVRCFIRSSQNARFKYMISP